MNTSEIIGHKKQIGKLEYLIKSKAIPNTILFTGPSGIGKKIIAKRFIKTLFCKKSAPPCLTCSTCNLIRRGTFPDVIEIYPNEKGNIPIGNEDKLEPGSVRWLIDRLTKKSLHEKTGILIDGFGRITEEGQNALLKTTEEPSLDAYFILLSSNRAKILPTILSRCSEIKFDPLSKEEIHKILLTKNLTCGDTDIISRISGGSAETALILSDQNMLNEILQLCGKITSGIKTDNGFNEDLSFLQKKIGTSKLLDIIISIFRENLLAKIHQCTDTNPAFNEFFIDDTEYISGIIKILLALKKSANQNINIKYALKGLLYSLGSSSTLNAPYTENYTSIPGGI